MGEKKLSVSAVSSLLWSTSAPRRASATAWRESTSGALSTHASTASRSAATESSSELLRPKAAFFNLELDVVYVVRVGSDSGLVPGRGLEIDKGAVL
jgi:hypothetical protein